MTDIKRDYLGRPLITPPDGGKAVPYTRASSYAKVIEDTYNLGVWRANTVALGVARDRAVLNGLAAVASTVPDPLRDRETKNKVAALADKAFIAGGGEKASAAGTALHLLSEAIDRGETPEFVPAELRAPLDAYTWGTTALKVEAIELFVVNDEVKSAGTLDRLYRLPDGRVVVADLKSGNNDPKYPGPVSAQVALYARSQRYDPETGERSPLHPDLDMTTGLLIHCPIFPPDGVFHCTTYPLDLAKGWERVQLAAQVRALKAIPKPKKVDY